MKIETTILNLVDAAADATIKADRLAWLCALLIKKVTTQSPVGDEALQILQRKINAMSRNDGGSSKANLNKQEQERKIFEEHIKQAVGRMSRINERQTIMMNDYSHGKKHAEQEGAEG